MPNSAVLYDPESELFRRPTMQRLFLAVGSDMESGKPDIRFLERFLDGPAWMPWKVGHTLHWHPFKLRLNDTPRAGLHVTTEWSDDGELRYASNFKIRSAGVFVFNPSNVMSSAEEIGSATMDVTEERLINRVLSERFGVPGGYRRALAMPLPPGALVDPSRFFLGAA